MPHCGGILITPETLRTAGRKILSHIEYFVVMLTTKTTGTHRHLVWDGQPGMDNFVIYLFFVGRNEESLWL